MTKRIVQPGNGPQKYALSSGFETLAAFLAEIADGVRGASFTADVAADCAFLRSCHTILADILRDRRCFVRDKREFRARRRKGTCGSDEAAFLEETIATLTSVHAQATAAIREQRKILARFPMTLTELDDFESLVQTVYRERCGREREETRRKRITERTTHAPLPAKEKPASPIAAALLGDGAPLPTGFVSSNTPVCVFVCKGPLSKADWQRLAELHRPGIVFRFLDRDGTQLDDAVISTPANRSEECFVVVDAVSRGSNPRLLSTLQPYDRAPRLRKVA